MRSTSSDSDQSDDLATRFGHRVVLPIAALIVVAMLFILGFVVVTAQRQDSAASAASRRLADTALEVRRHEMERVLHDYSQWTDAYRHLHLAFDRHWAVDGDNLGANVSGNLGYEMHFIVGPKGETRLAMVDGEGVEAEVGGLLGAGLDRLLTTARAGPAGTSTAVSGLLSAGGRVAVVAAAPIAPGREDLGLLVPGAPSLLVFVDIVDTPVLAQIGANYLLSGLRFTIGPAEGALLPLAAVDETGLAGLTWEPDRPGRRLLRSVLPTLLIAIAALLGLTVVVLRGAGRLAEVVQRSLRALSASQARFRDVAEVGSDWLWETDAGLRLSYLSDRFSEVTGLPRERALGRPLAGILEADGEAPFPRRPGRRRRAGPAVP